MFKLDFFKRKKKEEQDKERMKRHVRKAHTERGSDMPNTNPFGGS
jgi:hypothetical protein